MNSHGIRGHLTTYPVDNYESVNVKEEWSDR